MQNRIRTVRDALGISQSEFGARIGIGKTGVSRLENGHVTPTPQTIKSICREFAVDYLWLTTGEGEPFRDDQKVLHEIIDNMMYTATPAERHAFHDIVKLDRRYWVAISNFMKEISQED